MSGKLVGAALVQLATTLAGLYLAGRLVARPRELQDLQTALAMLETEIGCAATPLPSALLTAAAAVAGPPARLLAGCARRLGEGVGRGAAEALRLALGELGDSALAPGDLAPLQALAAVLGASGREDQVRHLRLARERLARAEVAAVEARQRYERVARYLGVLSGLAVVLLML